MHLRLALALVAQRAERGAGSLGATVGIRGQLDLVTRVGKLTLKLLEALGDEQARHAATLEEERTRLESELETARESAAAFSPEDAERVKLLERELSEARDQIELTADADRRAEAARAALSALRDESERQAQVHALTERELKAELEKLRAELPEASHK